MKKERKREKKEDYHPHWPHFLLVTHSKFGPISHHFRDTATNSLKLSIENIATKPLQIET